MPRFLSPRAKINPSIYVKGSASAGMSCEIMLILLSLDGGSACSGISKVKVLLSNGEELTLFKFYPDEITISESELIGRTVDEAKRLKFEKDVRYLQN
jgi:hypothetical protein